MIEIKSLTHTIRLFARNTSLLDLFRVVLYGDYCGDCQKIPWYYRIIKGYSCDTDLTQSMDEIMASMKSNTRNEIRRAMKEGCQFETEDDVDAFITFYNDFCKSKGLHDETSRARIGKFPHVLLTKAVKDGKVLAMHANILDEKSKTALLLYSCSQRLDPSVDTKLIGWGNRFLHYKDLEHLKSQGYVHYDWSGIVLDPQDPRYSIGQFKLAFGGKVIDSWSLQSPLYAFLDMARTNYRAWLSRQKSEGC